jgi:hypothetical protein
MAIDHAPWVIQSGPPQVVQAEADVDEKQRMAAQTFAALPRRDRAM